MTGDPTQDRPEEPPGTFDFLILGAQKSGTTTLFQILAGHADVFVPPGKELPFFTGADVTAASFARFWQTHFAPSRQEHRPDRPARRIGKVTPQYLCAPVVADRIARHAPQARLVAILRDPVARALSHYRMSARRGLDRRSFATAITDCLQPDRLVAARALPPGPDAEAQTYVVWGEYGRLLRPYAAQIAAGQMLVLFTQDLDTDPRGTAARLFAHIGVGWQDVAALGQTAHRGGDAERIPVQALKQGLRRVPGLRAVWRRVPLRWRSRVWLGLNTWNVVPGQRLPSDEPPAVIAALRAHFATDARLLRQVLAIGPDAHLPWDIPGDHACAGRDPVSRAGGRDA